jgi:hypothetical protein
MPDNFTPNVADLGVRSASVLESELAEAKRAIRGLTGDTAATPQVGDFASRLNSELSGQIEDLGLALLTSISKTVVKLLNLTQISGVVLASVTDQIRAGQTKAGTFVLSNLGSNQVTGLALIASQLKTLAGGSNSIDPTHVTFSPNPVPIAPGSSTTVTVSVAVPSGQPTGNYYGSIVDAASGQVRGMLSISVTPSQ